MFATTINITTVFDDYPELLQNRLALCQVAGEEWWAQYKKALQYLVGYGVTHYARINIHTDAYGEMTAAYYTSEDQGKADFIQGAVPRWSNLPDKPFEFTFHS